MPGTDLPPPLPMREGGRTPAQPAAGLSSVEGEGQRSPPPAPPSLVGKGGWGVSSRYATAALSTAADFGATWTASSSQDSAALRGW